MKQKTAFRSLHTLALALAFALLFVLVGGGEARAAEGDEAPYEEVFDGGYKIEGSGYLLVGGEAGRWQGDRERLHRRPWDRAH